MKYIFILLVFVSCTILFFSCSAQKDLSKQIYTYGYIFTEYSNKGFLFTPDQFFGKYESIGILVVEIYPPVYNEGASGSNQYGSDSYDFSPTWRYLMIQPKEVLDSLYSLGKSYGADAIVKLEITNVSQERSGFQNRIPGIKASGFAIKRLE